MNEFVNHCRISQLKHMSDKTGYHLSLDLFHFVSARFDLHVWNNVLTNIGDSKTFFLTKAIARKIALSKSTRFLPPSLFFFSSLHRQPKRTMFGFGLQRSFGWNILELLMYYLMQINAKSLKDMKSSCSSICTSSL